ncbi:MAG TPA: tripartite tricarboxylate transporter permease [Candidatus Acidoferrum sp.]|nr:tripartite tricarboxylate transporter permease [Candidatus Acidoferrum sp.]
MDFWHNVTLGFSVAGTPVNLLLCLVGVFLGTVIGVLPGIGPMTGVALLIPLTFTLTPTSAIILMAGIYYGAMYGGSTTSILVNTPGESSSVVTCLDGYQMAKQGRAGPALAAAAIGSFIAGTFATLMLMIFGPVVAQIALRFGPPEFFSLMVAALTMVTSLAGRSIVKALLSTFFGLAIATIGIDMQSGVPRFTFGSPELMDGLEFLTVAIGLFALCEVLVNLANLSEAVQERLSIKGRLWMNKEDWKRFTPSCIRGTLSGFFVGGIAGAGAAVASFVSYGIEKKASKYRDELGKGAIEGVTGPESANNAAAGGALIHLLCLGIPGSGTTAIMLGALLMLGLQPGPLLFQQQPQFVWGLIASMYIGNVMLLVLNLPLVGMWVKLLDVPLYLLLNFIILFSFLGVYTMNNSVQDLFIMVGFGVIGYLLKRLDIPATPIILGIVLGKLMEEKMRQSLVISDGSLMIFLTRPISLFLLILAVISITNPYWKQIGAGARRLFAKPKAA